MDEAFEMEGQKRGRYKYVLLFFLVTFLFSDMVSLLHIRGVPAVLLLVAEVSVMIWLIVFRVCHHISVSGDRITEIKETTNKSVSFRISEVGSVKRNLLRETVLKDRDGKTLLIVDSSLTNLDLFEEYLKNYNL